MKTASMCSKCFAKNNVEHKAICIECKMAGMNKTEVFEKDERKTIQNMVSR